MAGLLGLGSGQAAGTGTDPWGDRPAVDPRLGQSQSVNLDLRRLLLGSSFRLSLGATDDAGSSSPRLTAWGRVAGTTFDGRDGKVSLDGDVLTGTVGVDGEWDRLLAGLAVAHSRGDGSYTMPVAGGDDSGNLEQTLTSLHPYLRYAVNDRLDVWGLFGYGWGELDLEMDNGMTMETDTNLVMGAFGGRGILFSAAETGGFQVATRTDAMLTRTSSDAVANLAATDADAHRLRLILEGSRGFAWAEGRSLTPIDGSRASGMTGAMRRPASAWNWAAGCATCRPDHRLDHRSRGTGPAGARRPTTIRNGARAAQCVSTLGPGARAWR